MQQIMEHLYPSKERHHKPYEDCHGAVDGDSTLTSACLVESELSCCPSHSLAFTQHLPTAAHRLRVAVSSPGSSYENPCENTRVNSGR